REKLRGGVSGGEVGGGRRGGLRGHCCRSCGARGRGSAGLKRAAGGLALAPEGYTAGAGGDKRWRASGLGGKKLVDRLSTKAKVEGSKPVTSSAQPPPTS